MDEPTYRILCSNRLCNSKKEGAVYFKPCVINELGITSSGFKNAALLQPALASEALIMPTSQRSGVDTGRSVNFITGKFSWYRKAYLSLHWSMKVDRLDFVES